jgi:adenosine deaminase
MAGDLPYLSLVGLRVGQRLQENIALLPKVELRRHLTGSIRVETAHELLRAQDLADAPATVEATRQRVQFIGRTRGDAPYAEKVEWLQRCFVSTEAIERVAYEAIRDAADDRVVYMELRVAPHLIARRAGCTIDDVLQALVAARNKAMEPGDIRCSYILNLGRQQDARASFPVALACFEVGQPVFCGVAIHGDNLNFPVGDYAAIINGARRAGLGVTIRAGQQRGPGQVIEAITFMGADRIGHGMDVLDNEEAAETARLSGTVFEICMSANVYSGRVRRHRKHPYLKMREEDIPAVLCTNDPTICNTTLTQEFCHALRYLALSMPGVQQTILDSAEGAFLPDHERERLLDRLIEGFAAILPSDELLTALE